jgi:adenylosuccinate synthase
MKNVSVVLGLQWGDEGKGKIVDFLALQADCVVRFSGGANAGHTLIYKNKIIRNHLIPSGIFHKKVKCVIANGVVVDPEILIEDT